MSDRNENGSSVAFSRSVFLIARREFTVRARSKFYTIGTIVMVAALAAFVLTEAFVVKKPKATSVGFAGAAQQLGEPLKTTAAELGLNVVVRKVGSQAEGQNQVRSGELAALVSGSAESPHVAVKSVLDTTLRGRVEGERRQPARR